MDIETIGLNIRKCRNAKKMRQEDLAQKANVSSNYISAVERGVKIPSVETLIDIMNALGVSADMIFCDVIDAGVTEKNNQLDAKVSQLSTRIERPSMMYLISWLEVCPNNSKVRLCAELFSKLEQLRKQPETAAFPLR